MLKRTCIVLVFAFALALGTALIATPIGAQDQTYYTYVSEWNVPRGQWGAFEKERDQQNAALQHLVADGTIIAWGSDANYVHTEDGYTHEDFFVATSRAGILKALETLRPPATGGSYTSVTKHKDMFLHTMAHGGKTSSATTGYVRVGSWTAKPGEGRCQAVGWVAFQQPNDGRDAAPVLLFRDGLLDKRGQGWASAPCARVRMWRLRLSVTAAPL